MQKINLKLDSNNTNIKEKVYSLLKEMIINREFTPNEPLDAYEIAKSLGISRTPVRDALSMLDSDGFVKTIPRKGTFVAGLYEKDIREIYDARKMVELFTIEKGFTYLKENISELNKIIEKINNIYDSNENEVDNIIQNINLEFHAVIVRSSNNIKIINYYENLIALLGATRTIYNYLPDQERKRYAYRDHIELINFIDKGNLNSAKELLANHIEYTLNHLLKTIKIIKVF